MSISAVDEQLRRLLVDAQWVPSFGTEVLLRDLPEFTSVLLGRVRGLGAREGRETFDQLAITVAGARRAMGDHTFPTAPGPASLFPLTEALRSAELRPVDVPVLQLVATDVVSVVAATLPTRFETAAAWLRAGERSLEAATFTASPDPELAAALTAWHRELAQVQGSPDPAVRARVSHGIRAVLTVTQRTVDDALEVGCLDGPQHDALAAAVAEGLRLTPAPAGLRPRSPDAQARLLRLSHAVLALQDPRLLTGPPDDRLRALSNVGFGQVSLAWHVAETPSPAARETLLRLDGLARDYTVGARPITAPREWPPRLVEISPATLEAPQIPPAAAAPPPPALPLPAVPLVTERPDDPTIEQERVWCQRRDLGRLAEAALSGDPDARQQITAPPEEWPSLANDGRQAVAEMVSLAGDWVAFHAQRSRIPALKEELRSDLYLAAVQAAQTYDPNRTEHAAWMPYLGMNLNFARTHFFRGLDSSGQMREQHPSGMTTLTRARGVLNSRGIQDPSIQLLAEETGWTPQRVQAVLTTTGSLDQLLETRAYDTQYNPLLSTPAITPETAALHADDQAAVQTWYHSLPPLQQAIVQRRIEGMNVEDIGQALDISPSSIYRQLRAAKETFTAALAVDEPPQRDPAAGTPDMPPAVPAPETTPPPAGGPHPNEWAAAVDAVRDRWASRPAMQRLLDALVESAATTGSGYISASTAELSRQAHVERSAVARALQELRSGPDPILEHVTQPGAGERAVHRLVMPPPPAPVEPAPEPPPPEPEPAGPDPAAWAAAIDAVRDRWADRPSVLRLLDTVADSATTTGDARITLGVRDLAARAQLDPGVVSRALKQLRAEPDPVIEAANEPGRGVRAVHRLVMPTPDPTAPAPLPPSRDEGLTR